MSDNDLLDTWGSKLLNDYLDYIDTHPSEPLNVARRDITYVLSADKSCPFVEKVCKDEFDANLHSSEEARRAGYLVDTVSIPARWSDDNAVDFLNLRNRDINVSEKVFDAYLKSVGTLSKKHETADYLAEPDGFENYVHDLYEAAMKQQRRVYSIEDALDAAIEDLQRSTGDPLEDKMNMMRRRLGSNSDKSACSDGTVNSVQRKNAKTRADIAKDSMLKKRAKQAKESR